MKLLITGSSGFIGRHATQAALARGWEVEGFDSAHSSENKRMDVRLLGRIEADVVLHLAAYSSNAGFAANMAENWACNVFGTGRVLHLAQKHGARVVYASSSAVYGTAIPDRQGNRLNHEDELIHVPVSHYANSKLVCEMMARVNSLGLRIFNAYGPGDEAKPAGRQAPPTWMRAAKDLGEPMVIFGDGTQAKDFIHVSDVVEIIMRLIESEAAGIVNVGTGTATSFNRLAQLIGGAVEYRPVPDPASYQFYTRAATTRLLSLIGPYEFKSIEEGLVL